MADKYESKELGTPVHKPKFAIIQDVRAVASGTSTRAASIASQLGRELMLNKRLSCLLSLSLSVFVSFFMRLYLYFRLFISIVTNTCYYLSGFFCNLIILF